MRYLYDIMDIPHQLEKLDNLHMRHQPFISYWKGTYIFSWLLFMNNFLHVNWNKKKFTQ
jgi:hypothetical protein